MSHYPPPPETYQEFRARFPQVGQAWDLLAAAGAAGPLDERTVRLVKLGIAVASQREGAVHSAARKAVAAGIPREAIEQVIALAASNIGLPSAVAVYTWVRDVLDQADASGG